MSIQGIADNSVYRPEQAVNSAAEAEKTANKRPARSDVSSALNAPADDRFTRSEEDPKKVTGLYSLVTDKNGKQSVKFDAPLKQSADKKTSGGGKKSVSAAKNKVCTGDTGGVDREIRKLKEKKQRLERQLSASGGAEDNADLQKQLDSVESELRQKDNDSYRRMHTSFSMTV